MSKVFPLLSCAISTSWYVNFISGFVKELTELSTFTIPSGKCGINDSGRCHLRCLVLLKPLGRFLDFGHMRCLMILCLITDAK